MAAFNPESLRICHYLLLLLVVLLRLHPVLASDVKLSGSEHRQNVQNCLKAWTTYGSWVTKNLKPSLIGSSSHYESCELYSGQNSSRADGSSKVGRCTEASWEFQSHSTKCNATQYPLLDIASRSADMAAPAENTWLHFMGDSSLRIFYSAFASHLVDTAGPNTARFPGHDFCYSWHSKLDQCKQFPKPCERSVDNKELGYARVSYQFTTTLRYFEDYFNDMLDNAKPYITTMRRRTIETKTVMAASKGTRTTTTMKPATTKTDTTSDMRLPDILIMRAGPWELYGYSFPTINFTHPISSSRRYRGIINPQDGRNHENRTLLEGFVNRFLHFLEEKYASASANAKVIWLVGYCDDTSPEQRAVEEDSVACGDLERVEDLIQHVVERYEYSNQYGYEYGDEYEADGKYKKAVEGETVEDVSGSDTETETEKTEANTEIDKETDKEIESVGVLEISGTGNKGKPRSHDDPRDSRSSAPSNGRPSQTKYHQQQQHQHHQQQQQQQHRSHLQLLSKQEKSTAESSDTVGTTEDKESIEDDHHHQKETAPSHSRHVHHYILNIKALNSPLPKEYGSNMPKNCPSFSYLHRPGLFAEQVVKLLVNAIRLVSMH